MPPGIRSSPKSAEPDRSTQGVVELNRLLYSSPDWYTTIVPLRDGVAVAMRV